MSIDREAADTEQRFQTDFEKGKSMLPEKGGQQWIAGGGGLNAAVKGRNS